MAGGGTARPDRPWCRPGAGYALRRLPGLVRPPVDVYRTGGGALTLTHSQVKRQVPRYPGWATSKSLLMAWRLRIYDVGCLPKRPSYPVPWP